MVIRRTAGAAGAAVLLAFSAGIQAASSPATADLPVIVVRVDNLVGVLPGDLQFAEQRASEVFAQIGVQIRWIDVEESFSQHVLPSFTVVLENAEVTREARSRSVEPLGFAHPSVRRAYVLYDRIAALKVTTPRTIPSLLGDVIAHELGHLLLPLPGHSADGIMRPGLETKSWYVNTFTKPQAREVLSRIRALD